MMTGRNGWQKSRWGPDMKQKQLFHDAFPTHCGRCRRTLILAVGEPCPRCERARRYALLASALRAKNWLPLIRQHLS